LAKQSNKTVTPKAGSLRGKKPPGQASLQELALWKRVLFRVVCVVAFPCLFILLLEGALWIGGYGYPTSAIIPHKSDGNAYYGDNPRFGWRYFPRRIARSLEPFVLDSVKKADTYRIFVLGGSAAQGTPQPAFGFARILDKMLSHAYPNVQFEVINAAMTAINSHVVLEIAKDCIRHKPDLFIIYLGNNEVVGPYGAGTVFAPLSSSLPLIRFNTAVKKTRLGQLASNIKGHLAQNGQLPMAWNGLEMFVDNHVRGNAPGLQKVYAHFKQNLEDTVDLARRDGVQTIVCTVGVNLRDCAPFASLNKTDLSEEQKSVWNTHFSEGVAHEKGGSFDEAIKQYLLAHDIDSQHAELQFRLARCRQMLDQHDLARECYIKARDLDVLRFRADSHINDIIRQVATAKADELVHLADIACELDGLAENSVPGCEFFYEHVHLNFMGNYAVASKLAEAVHNCLPGHIVSCAREDVEFLSERECAERLAFTVLDQYRILDRLVGKTLAELPFSGRPYNSESLANYRASLEAIRTELATVPIQVLVSQLEWAIQQDRDDWYLVSRCAGLRAKELKDCEGAIRQYNRVLELVPHDCIARGAIALELFVLGQYERGLEHCRKAVKINPTKTELHFNMGMAHEKLGNAEEAILCYGRAVKWYPCHEGAYVNWASLVRSQGKLDEAIAVCYEGLRFLHESANLHYNLAVFLQDKGLSRQAIGELRVVLKLDPNDAQAQAFLKKLQPVVGE